MGDLANLAVGVAMFGSFAISATRKMLERRRARRELAARPDLGDLGDADGVEARVTGIVRMAKGPDALVAPISGRRCVMYRARVKSVEALSKNLETFEMVPFVLEPDHGEPVAIEGTHALLDLPGLTTADPKTPEDRERCSRFALRHGLPVNARAVYDEIVVEDGMRVTIAGLVMKDVGLAPGDAEAGYRDDAPTTLRLAGDTRHPLAIGRATSKV